MERRTLRIWWGFEERRDCAIAAQIGAEKGSVVQRRGQTRSAVALRGRYRRTESLGHPSLAASSAAQWHRAVRAIARAALRAVPGGERGKKQRRRHRPSP